MPSGKKPCAGTPCADRTINLAKKGNSLEERRTKLLIFEKSAPPLPSLGAQLPPGITSMKCPKRIRVCTALDMKRTCPPPVCDCPPLRPLTFLGMLRKCAWFGCKAAVAGGLVYWTWDIGLWGDTEKTHKLYHQMKDFVIPPDEDVRNPLEHPAQAGRLVFKAKNGWNHMVSKSFQYTYMAAEKLGSFMEPKEPVCEKPEKEH